MSEAVASSEIRQRLLQALRQLEGLKQMLKALLDHKM